MKLNEFVYVDIMDDECCEAFLVLENGEILLDESGEPFTELNERAKKAMKMVGGKAVLKYKCKAGTIARKGKISRKKSLHNFITKFNIRQK